MCVNKYCGVKCHQTLWCHKILRYHFTTQKRSSSSSGTAVQKKGDKKPQYKSIIDVKQMLHDTIHDPNQPSLIGSDEKLMKPLAMFANR